MACVVVSSSCSVGTLRGVFLEYLIVFVGKYPSTEDTAISDAQL